MFNLTAYPILDVGSVGLGRNLLINHLVYVMGSLTADSILEVGGFRLGGPLPNIHLV